MMNYPDLIHSPILTPEMARLIQKCAINNAPVLILGEQGTGKELIAKTIHQAGDWKSYPFYRVDCRILRANDLFSQLRLHFEEVRFGMTPATFFLNEVGCLSPMDQLKLLELVEDGLFKNGVETKTIKNIRCLFSSSENLQDKVERKQFSEDLYFRLTTLTIHLPALRDRPREIGAIAQYLLEEHAKQLKIKKRGISNHVLRRLETYWWPGNLKELERVIIQGAILSEGDTIMEKDLLIQNGAEKHSFYSFIKQAETKPIEPPKSDLQRNQNNGLNISDATLFFIELVHRIKNPLVSIKTFTQLLRNKFHDPEFREYFYRIVTEDIEKIDGVLNGLLNYIKVNHPIEKRDTIHSILEDVLKQNGEQIENKKIKLFKKYEKDLPETILHEEQLRYILTSLIQFAMPSIPAGGSIGFLTKSIEGRKEDGKGQLPIPGDKKFVEIMMVFTGYKKSIEPLDTLFGIPPDDDREVTDLELRLLKEMIERNRGTMKFEVNEKKLRTIISLRFPVERRKVITYQPTCS